MPVLDFDKLADALRVLAEKVRYGSASASPDADLLTQLPSTISALYRPLNTWTKRRR
jgi:hypothetical protein